VNLSTASFDELQQIIHIGPTRAQQIIELRPFASGDDLTTVSGIGTTRLQDIKNQGLA
jgi:competence protein ComEC